MEQVIEKIAILLPGYNFQIMKKHTQYLTCKVVQWKSMDNYYKLYLYWLVSQTSLCYILSLPNNFPKGLYVGNDTKIFKIKIASMFKVTNEIQMH